MNLAGSKQLDSQRLAEWHAEYSVSLGAFARGLLRSHTLAEEVVQSTFSKALSHGAEVQTGSEKAWLFQVAYHEAMAIRRRQEIDQRALKSLERPNETDEKPESAVLHQEQKERIRNAILSLPVEQQLVVHERIFEERTFQEIADKFYLPLGTVLTRMRLALRSLQKRLQDDQ